jgi:hypothetical protein
MQQDHIELAPAAPVSKGEGAAHATPHESAHEAHPPHEPEHEPHEPHEAHGSPHETAASGREA